MIVLPFIGVITAAQAGLWVAGGVVSAVTGWLVRHILKVRHRVATLETRVEALEDNR